MNQVRIHGDPFGEDWAASLLRSFLRFALGNGMRCALSLSAVRTRAPAAGERAIPLTDGVRDLNVATALPPAEVDLLLRAASQAIPASAPVLVFAPTASEEARLMAGLEWPRAAVVLDARDGTTAGELLARVRAELRWAGSENRPAALGETELAAWMALPPPPAEGPIVHVGRADFASGTDLVVDAWQREFVSHPLRLVLPGVADHVVDELQRRLAGSGAVEIVRAEFAARHLCDAAAIVLPWRRLVSARELLGALASGRPLAVSRFAATAPFVGRCGTCLPIGGRCELADAFEAAHFAPDARALSAAMRRALGGGAAMADIARRARRHVVEQWAAGSPAAPPAPVQRQRRARPTIVLEAPFFETSSTAELSIETARALRRRDAVDVRLVPTLPLRGTVGALRCRAPELVPLLVRDPGPVDLWLASGWPVRATRPACGTLALRVDWEFGALPIESTPHVTQEADLVIVHSEHVAQTVEAAGRPRRSIRIVPHGVDAAMHEHAPPDDGIVQWKQGRTAVLFCGGLIWRKGFDVFLRAVLGARAAGHDFCVVIKTVGHEQHYCGFHLGELAEKVRATKGAPPLLLIEQDLSRTELASLYTACDLMLHPYRGEGFGLPVLEARACGLPVLATRGGACDALMGGPGAVPLPAVRRALELPDPHVGQPWVLEPVADEVARLLMQSLAAVAERRAEARSFAGAMRDAFSWDAAARSIEQMAFEAMLGRPAVDPVPERLVELRAAVPALVGSGPASR
ncbi:MAG TPA: glycosyltransferase [Planctomycetota bacterium]|nr:glycosyltransferase [Planctomycetota bacterium]